MPLKWIRRFIVLLFQGLYVANVVAVASREEHLDNKVKASHLGPSDGDVGSHSGEADRKAFPEVHDDRNLKRWSRKGGGAQCSETPSEERGA